MTALGIRQNNPLNIRPGARKWLGELPSTNGYCWFDTPANGLRAAGKNLLAYQSVHDLHTIAGIIKRWAPADDNNDVAAYVAAVSSDVGIDYNADIDLTDASVMSSMLMAMCQHENGSMPYDVRTFERAASAAVNDGLEW